MLIDRSRTRRARRPHRHHTPRGWIAPPCLACARARGRKWSAFAAPPPTRPHHHDLPEGVGGHPQPGRCLACAPVRAIGKRWVRDPVGRFLRKISAVSGDATAAVVPGVAAKSNADGRTPSRGRGPGSSWCRTGEGVSGVLLPLQEQLRQVVTTKPSNELRRDLSERGKIPKPADYGASRRHQRQIAVAIKRAREMALLPYVTKASPALPVTLRRAPLTTAPRATACVERAPRPRRTVWTGA